MIFGFWNRRISYSLGSPILLGSDFLGLRCSKANGLALPLKSRRGFVASSKDTESSAAPKRRLAETLDKKS